MCPNQLRRKEVPRGKPAEQTACHQRHAAELATAALALHHRQQFWMDTCRDVREMRTASPQALELHQQHGCLFFVPALQQVQFVLDALDSALPGWDRDHPELFYRTLELNFPELLRSCRVQRRG